MKPAQIRLTAVACALCMLLAVSPESLFAQGPSSQLELRTSRAGTALAGAMSKLATEPRNLDALLIAGEAALDLEDPRSALGFFGRADDVSANNGRVKAGLGRAMLQLDQVGDGLRLMEQAGNLGYGDAGLFADRGLARDLSGNQTGAQQDYAAALKLDRGNEKAIRRLAVSYGIAGQLDIAQATLQPLLYKSDRGAWRDRAFILAMNGKTSEAIDITRQVMPRALADAIKPYMERIAMLTPGQRAAAVHFGQFPPGLVKMRVASTAVPVKPAVVPPPANVKKGGKTEVVRREQAAATKPVSPPAHTQESARPAPPVTPAQPARVERTVQGPPSPARVAATARSRPTVPLSDSGPTAAAVPAPTPARPSSSPASALPARPSADRTLAQIISEIDVPETERRSGVAVVDLAEIAAMQAAQREARAVEAAKAKEAARLKAEAAAKAKAKAEAEAAAKAEKKRLADNPARYWVQIGIGRDKDALAFTLRRMQKEFPSLAKRDGWSATWGRTNRLVVGPFSTLAKAKDVEAELKKGGSDGFVWRSEAGEQVDKIGR